MSGNTSETRCDKCYFLACPCAGRGVCGCACHAEPTPPEGEAVPEQKGLTLDDIKNLTKGHHRCEPDGCGCNCGMIYNEKREGIISRYGRHHPECKCNPAPVVSTAAPEPPTRNSEVIKSFVDYCRKNPEFRFWQALRNWSGYRFILAADCSPATFTDDNRRDTFDWEGKRHDEGK